MDRDELWRAARDDAGYSSSGAVWMEIPGKPPGGRNATFAFAAPPGENYKAVPLDDSGREWAEKHRDKLRVFTFEEIPEPTEPATLGLMRWALEFGRLATDEGHALKLIQLTHVASQDRIRAAGAGGAMHHHSAPNERQQQAAAAALVLRFFGPQAGQLRRTFGPLFREEEKPQPREQFSRRAVAFAAFHHEDLEKLERAQGVNVAQHRARVDPNAQSWWTTLTTDDEFLGLSAASPFVLPTREETEAAEGAAPSLWTTLVDLYRRAERRALRLLP